MHLMLRLGWAEDEEVDHHPLRGLWRGELFRVLRGELARR